MDHHLTIVNPLNHLFVAVTNDMREINDMILISFSELQGKLNHKNFM